MRLLEPNAVTARKLASLTTDEARALCTGAAKTAVLLPVGSVEPHGPHLPLGTDTTISFEASLRAIDALAASGVAAVVAPSVPYGVTEYADGFAGALSIPPQVLTAYLTAIVGALLADGWSHVCLVNNHLEPAHDAAVRAAIAGIAPGRASVACPLTRRWARTLSDEFKRGDCHAGRYETSLVLAANEDVRAVARTLPTLTTSLATEIKAGKTTFGAMGLDRAYTGAPAEATLEEGDLLYAKLVAMIVGEVTEGLAKITEPT
jgi:creatinine amidohydrolase